MFDKLKAPFDPKAISWRVGSMSKDKAKGMALAYIDARDVMERLDEVCGPAGWQDRYEFHGSRTVCYLSISIANENGSEWVTKADGAGDSDVEAEKGAISDAFKRAAVKWGIGRYLYDVKTPWVELDEWKHIKESEMPKLWRALGGSPPAKQEAPAERPQNVSSGIPAKPVEPAVTSAAVKLARELKSNKTVPDFDAMKRQPEFIQAYKELAPHDKEYVNVEANRHRAAIEGADLRMAG